MLKLQSPKLPIVSNPIQHRHVSINTNLSFRRQTSRLFAKVSISNPSRLTSSVSQPPQFPLTHKHFLFLNVFACLAAVSASWLFLAAIPTMLAFKKAAESLEKLLDVTREELPDTMAAVRLSGMEISDLTMELSDLGQGITQGVKSSTRAIRVAEDRLRRLTNTKPVAMQEEVMVQSKREDLEPKVARTARNLKEGIVKGRSLWQLLFTITRFSKMASSYLANRAKQ